MNEHTICKCTFSKTKTAKLKFPYSRSWLWKVCQHKIGLSLNSKQENQQFFSIRWCQTSCPNYHNYNNKYIRQYLIIAILGTLGTFNYLWPCGSVWFSQQFFSVPTHIVKKEIGAHSQKIPVSTQYNTKHFWRPLSFNSPWR